MGGTIILTTERIYIPGFIIFILLIPIWLLVLINRYRKAKRNLEIINIEKEILVNILILYCIFVFSVTILPMNIKFKRIAPKVNMIPVVYFLKKVYIRYLNSGIIAATIYWINNIIGNFILLLPLGYILPKVSDKYKEFKNIFKIIFLITISIELFQYISMIWGNRRTTDIDDIILNVLGGIVGYIIYKRNFNSKKRGEINEGETKD